ncbi:MepB family protein [Staphylococcus sp. 11261D007BR]
MKDTYISKNLVTSTIDIISNSALTNFKVDNLNSDYEAFTFDLDKLTFKSRLARKTPKKEGVFCCFLAKKRIQ